MSQAQPSQGNRAQLTSQGQSPFQFAQVQQPGVPSQVGQAQIANHGHKAQHPIPRGSRTAPNKKRAKKKVQGCVKVKHIPSMATKARRLAKQLQRSQPKVSFVSFYVQSVFLCNQVP